MKDIRSEIKVIIDTRHSLGLLKLTQSNLGSLTGQTERNFFLSKR
jgi:hypothetical protein